MTVFGRGVGEGWWNKSQVTGGVSEYVSSAAAYWLVHRGVLLWIVT